MIWYHKLARIILLYCLLCSSTQQSKAYSVSNEQNLETKEEFTSEAIKNEYIIKFDDYYSKKKRHRIVLSLFESHRLIDVIWSIIPHNNFFVNKKSDFDVIKVNDFSLKKLKGILSDSRITSITRHKKVLRKLNHVLINSNDSYTENKIVHPLLRSLFRVIPKRVSIPEKLSAGRLWAAGYKGKGVKIAVFDTGLSSLHPHFKNVVQRTDWTGEKIADDSVGHGTFVASVIGGSSPTCPGLAPEAKLFICRVFTNSQVSYTSWFLDAFNYAIQQKVDILNLSIGGSDFLDKPFVDKVLELSANNIIMVSAIGNDGPLYGTLNNPADQMDVIGVGGMESLNSIAQFSSRGMTTWELPLGYGRVKPDIVTYVSNVWGSGTRGECRTLSGTSVAAPVVTGVIALLLSSLSQQDRKIMNPASVKQVLMDSADQVVGANMFEQGRGSVNLVNAYQVMHSYKPQASLFPSELDWTDCPYMWPYCSQPLYYGGMPIIANITLINGMGVTGKVVGKPTWNPHNAKHKEFLDISISNSPVLYPWSGYMSIHMSVSKSAANWDGFVRGHVSIELQSAATVNGTKTFHKFVLRLPMNVQIIPTPPRDKRVLWDQFHNLRYPKGYFPRDDLSTKNDLLDWNADHIHTNFRGLYQYLRQQGYYIEVLGQPFTCFNANDYSTLIIVDPEEEFFDEEILKLKNDVLEKKLSLIVFADWYNSTVMAKIKFFDENTQSWWHPQTGGSNVPALNDLLRHFGVSLGGQVYKGSFSLAGKNMYYASGTNISQFPKRSLIVKQKLRNEGMEIVDEKSDYKEDVVILGLHQLEGYRSGRIAVYGDSNCIDDAHNKKDCFWMFNQMLEYTSMGLYPYKFKDEVSVVDLLGQADVSGTYEWNAKNKPHRMPDNHLEKYSKVLRSQTATQLVKREIPVCQHLTWVKPQVKNETVAVLARQPLSLDTNKVVAALPEIDENFMGGGDEESAVMWSKVVLMIAACVVFYCLLKKCMLTRRRRTLAPRIVIRCCFSWWKRFNWRSDGDQESIDLLLQLSSDAEANQYQYSPVSTTQR